LDCLSAEKVLWRRALLLILSGETSDGDNCVTGGEGGLIGSLLTAAIDLSDANEFPLGPRRKLVKMSCIRRFDFTLFR